MTDATIAELERSSVQAPPDAKENPNGSGDFWGFTTYRGTKLPPRGTRWREHVLREWYFHEYNWLARSAIAGQIKKLSGAPWTIKGKRNVDYFQNVLMNADFQRGWKSLISKSVIDFFRQDSGGWWEIIAPGNPMRAPTGKVMGIAPLDSLRIVPTGDPEYPALYTPPRPKGGKPMRPRLLHNTRVIQLADMADSDERWVGYGDCTTSRAISILARDIEMSYYIETKLDEKPPPGIVNASNLTIGQRDAAYTAFRQEQSTDESPPWGRTMWLYSVNPQFASKIEYITFRQAPENWDYEQYTNLNVNAFALAMGVDVQELWQLTGGNIGSAGQSAVLHAKSQGKTPGDLLTTIERIVNLYVLPDYLTFEFKRHDPYEEDERATTAGKWAGFNTSVASTLSVDEQRRLLAATVEVYHDIVTDDDGTVTTLTDADPEAAEQEQDDTGTAPAQATGGQETQDDTTPAEKDYPDTRARFVADLTDLLRAGVEGDVDRRRAGTVMRAQLSRLGRTAYEDGLKAGGVDDGMNDTDRAALAAWLASQNTFVAPLLDTLYDKGLTDAEIQQHAEMWANKSLNEAHQLGLARADADGLYLWRTGAAEDHCVSCLRMNGQKHRLSEYMARSVTPGSNNLACGGFNCRCSLVKTSGKSAGNW